MKKQEPQEIKVLRAKRKRQIKRDLILEVAQKAFIEHGYDNTMVDQIALEAGYTKATLYKYFESKEDLFAGILSKIYVEMHDSFVNYLSKPRKSSGLLTVGNAYLEFVSQHQGEAALLDSGRCVTINRTIIRKEELNQPLTESEEEFHKNETKAGMVIMNLLAHSLQEFGVENKMKPEKLIKILSAFMPTIRELIRRGNVAGQSVREIRSTLSILFKIIEQGVKHYE